MKNMLPHSGWHVFFVRLKCPATSGTPQKFFPHLQPVCKAEQFVYVLKTVDFHCRRTLSLYNSTRSTSVQEDRFHSVYFAAGMARASSFATLTVGSQGSWDCTIVRPTEDLLLFPQESPPSVPINKVAHRINER